MFPVEVRIGTLLFEYDVDGGTVTVSRVEPTDRHGRDVRVPVTTFAMPEAAWLKFYGDATR